jgi:aspartate-semialdehyde dehydrogenase
MPGVEKVSVGAYRVPVQKGHLVDVRVRFKRTIGAAFAKPSARDVQTALESFDPLRDVPLPSKPRRAIVVKPLDEVVGAAGDDGGSSGSAGAARGGSAGAEAETGASVRPPPRLGTPRPRDDCEFENGMAICVGNIDAEDDVFDVSFCVVVNNVARGAWGAALLNAEYWTYLRNRKADGAGDE